MGLSGISLSSLLLIFFIAVLIFGSKRLGSIGKDLGAALKGFREGMAVDEHRVKSAHDVFDVPTGADHDVSRKSTYVGDGPDSADQKTNVS